MTAAQFNRVLFQSPQVTTTRELDRLSELEGDLIIEVGKNTNQVAIKFNQIVAGEMELAQYFERLQITLGSVPPSSFTGGWQYLLKRLEIAKNWARRGGKTPMVREINALIKQGITRLDETILDHCSALDTLITETCNQHGIALEIFGELSPFTKYVTPMHSTVESLETIPSVVGAGV